MRSSPGSFLVGVEIFSHLPSYLSNKCIGLPLFIFLKSLEFIPHERGKLTEMHPGLMLLPTIEDIIIYKTSSIRYLFMSLKFYNLEIGFALLTKVVAFHLRITIMKLRILRLEKLAS